VTDIGFPNPWAKGCTEEAGGAEVSAKEGLMMGTKRKVLSPAGKKSHIIKI